MAFSNVVNQVGGAFTGAQKQLGEIIETYLPGTDLPSRLQMTDLGAA